jgi:hypothetical protein
MHSSRVFAIAVAVSLWACGEEEPGVLVKDDLAWQLGCPSGVNGCTSFHGHTKTESEHFSARCDKNSGGLDIRIEDKGSAEDERPGSIVHIEGLDPKNGTCGSVRVTEAPNLDVNAGEFFGNCEDAECTVEGSASDGWNFTGTIKCNNLDDGNGNLRTLQAPGGGGMPLSIDNCG